MSLRALPKDLCTSSHRLVPRPPLPSGAGGTGSKKKFPRPSMPYGLSASLAVAQRQIRQKRRLHHWRHARQLSLCIGKTEYNGETGQLNQLLCLPAHQPGCGQMVNPAKETRQQQLIETMKTLVETRTQLANHCDPSGVLHVNAYLLCVAGRIRAVKSDG